MMEKQKKIELLQKIAHRLNEAHVQWALGASMLLYFKSITSEFHDIDLMVADHAVSVRLKHASYLLRFSDLSISEIAQQVGFEDNNYFSRCFRQNMSMTPSEYRSHDDNNL